MESLTIGRVARAAEVNVETIRFYERKGLLEQPERPPNGFRTYPEATVARVRFIRKAKDLGFTLKEIGELLELRVDPGASCDDVRRRAEAKLAQVDRKIEGLRRVRCALADLVAACGTRAETDACPILEVLEDR